MKTPELGQWQRTSPFAVIFFFGKVIRLILKNAWQSLAPLLAFAVAYQGDLVETAVIAGSAFLVFIGTAAVLRYWFFRFQISPDAILIRQGVLKKSQLNIKFDRIQGINTEQNVVYRYLGLVTVSFDTAGSAGDEGNLPAVPRDFADDLRKRISRPRRDDDGTTEEPDIAPLLQLDWRDMIRIGLSDKRALVVLAILGPLAERLDENVEQTVGELIDKGSSEALEFGIAFGVPLIVGAVVGIVLLLVLLSIGAAFWRYHGFELTLADDTLRSTGGLLTRHEVSMHLGKVQTLRLQQGIILRGFGRFRMTARQARASHKNAGNKDFTIPIVTADEAAGLRRRILGPEGRGLVQAPGSDAFQRISAFFMRSRLIASALVPLAVASGLFWIGRDALVFLLLLATPLLAVVIYQAWRHAGYLVTDEGLVRRSGIIGYRTVALLYRKVQRVTVSQSPLQRRKELATLRVYMASGSVKIPYIPHALARQLQDYILYKIESSQRAWH